MRRWNTKRHRRKGVVLVLVAVVLLALAAFIALAVDGGKVYVAHNELQNAVDAAALAAAKGLSASRQTAIDMALEYARKNNVNGNPLVLTTADIEMGTWSPDSGFELLSSSDERATAIRINGRLHESRSTEVRLHFAKILGIDHVNMAASAVATFGTRDIAVVLDYSGSMNDDTQLQQIPQLGRSEVESYLAQIWQELKDADSRLNDVAATRMNEPAVQISSTSSDNTIKEQLRLRYRDERNRWVEIPYPYPPRDWGDYFDYVQSSSRPSTHRNRYGYLTWMDYLQAEQYIYNTHRVPLYATSHQPMTAVKDAVTIFLAYLNQQPTDDRVALVSYTYTGGNGGHVEQTLTDNFGLIEQRSRALHAGYYHNNTHIAGGIQEAIRELNNGRDSALRFIVLLSDGQANLPSRNPDRAALDQAREARERRFPIITISLGANADTDLMQEIADITRGVHFVIPGGSNVRDYEEDLFEVFRMIADHRALKLVL